MTAQERALSTVAQTLDEARLPYMIIGGQANAVWGEPRATIDIDVTIWAEGRADAVSLLSARFRVLVDDPERFVRETRVLPLESDEGVRVDAIFGLLPFEQEAIRRAVPIRVGDRDVRVCTAEDLILTKIISSRERDLADARAIALRRMGELDLAYLDPRVAELSDLLERPEIRALWNGWKSALGSRPSDMTR